MMNTFRFVIIYLLITVIPPDSFGGSFYAQQNQDAIKVDREYVLESTMLGYFAADGTRNPVLRAKKGEMVRIKIVNGELMGHDIVLKKLNVRSTVILDKGESTSIVFKAVENDTYYCSIPGHEATMSGKFEVVEGELSNAFVANGILAQKDGRPLNFNFEGGVLTDWKAQGDAFSKPILVGDSSEMHRKGMIIGQKGHYFITSGGTKNHKATGTLTSSSFRVTHPFASFLVSGGALQDTRVELVLADTDSVFFQITGTGRATLQPVVVDMKAILYRDIFIRLVDNETGISPIPYIGPDIWGHINFDDFQFYAERPVFANELKRSDIIIMPPLDLVLHSGLSGKEAAAAMSLPKEFSVTLAAAEPDIVRPISFTIDSRGRLWVVEAHTYPIRAAEGQGRDRILIFEDTNGDGTLDKRTIFMEGLNLVSGIEVGMGGVWLGAAPYLQFIPIDKTGDKPAGPPQILLDGWGYQDTHETLNSLRWGPDGWLYGAHGVFTHSNVGKPGDPDEKRQKLNGAFWRYHPTKKEFEVFAHGTSNPWGIDFNDYGHAFSTVCVIPHLFHVVQGARYHRQAGNHFNPYTYDDIKTIADHVHWVGDRGPHAGNFRSNTAGGGHAHAGAMIYLGSENWPKEFRESIFMNSIHGAMVNVDKLERRGSGYVGKHSPDFLKTNDIWSQWLNFRYDATGSVYAIDWYDKNQCHSGNPDVHDKTLGRIFRIAHEKDIWVQVDLSKASNMELVNHQLNKNEWYVTQSRMILQERGANKKVHKALLQILDKNPDVTRKLRALWTLHATQGLTEKKLIQLLSNENEYIRSWAIQLAAENSNLSKPVLVRFAEMARQDPSALVRLYLASAMQRTKAEDRWEVVEALYQHTEDATDHNLPLMYWYTGEPLVALDANRALELALKSKMPNTLTYTIKRIGALATPESKQTLQTLAKRLEKMGNPHQFHAEQAVITELLK